MLTEFSSSFGFKRCLLFFKVQEILSRIDYRNLFFSLDDDDQNNINNKKGIIAL